MSIIYTNDFETGELIGWSGNLSENQAKSPTHSMLGSQFLTFSEGFSDVTTLNVSLWCDNMGDGDCVFSYYDAGNNLQNLQNVPSDSTWHDYNFTINGDIGPSGIVFTQSQPAQMYVDDISINGLTVTAGEDGFTPTQGATIINTLSTGFADSIIPMLPTIFGLLVGGLAVLWALKRLIGIFKRN